jgi:hypothetical protein
MALFNIVLTCSFLAYLLLFWLCILDEMRISSGGIISHDSSRGRPMHFYMPKIVLVMSLWTLLITTFAYVRTSREGNPTYEGLDDSLLRAAYVQ